MALLDTHTLTSSFISFHIRETKKNTTIPKQYRDFTDQPLNSQIPSSGPHLAEVCIRRYYMVGGNRQVFASQNSSSRSPLEPVSKLELKTTLICNSKLSFEEI